MKSQEIELRIAELEAAGASRRELIACLRLRSIGESARVGEIVMSEDVRFLLSLLQERVADTDRLNWLFENTRVCQDWKWTGDKHPNYGDNNDLLDRHDIDRAVAASAVRAATTDGRLP